MGSLKAARSEYDIFPSYMAINARKLPSAKTVNLTHVGCSLPHLGVPTQRLPMKMQQKSLGPPRKPPVEGPVWNAREADRRDDFLGKGECLAWRTEVGFLKSQMERSVHPPVSRGPTSEVPKACPCCGSQLLPVILILQPSQLMAMPCFLLFTSNNLQVIWWVIENVAGLCPQVLGVNL